MEIKNMPASTERYIVVRIVDGEYWFYGSYDNRNKAYSVSYEFENGTVIDRDTEL